MWSPHPLLLAAPVSALTLLVPPLLVFLVGGVGAWVHLTAQQASKAKQLAARLAQLSPPKPGENHHSLQERVYRLQPVATTDEKQKQAWRQWVDFLKVKTA